MTLTEKIGKILLLLTVMMTLCLVIITTINTDECLARAYENECVMHVVQCGPNNECWGYSCILPGDDCWCAGWHCFC
jgi:hypothetical protein